MYDWQISLLLMFGGVVTLLMMKMPVALTFIAMNLVGAIFYFGGDIGIIQMIRNMRPSVSQYALAPIPLFVLMGEVMLQSGMATRSIAAIDRLISRVPGRLSVVAILGGTSFAALSGSSVANAAVVGRSLVPEMQNRGYHPTLALGPVAAVGGIAVLIPPSAMAVMLGSLAQISINELLIAGIVPGFLMAAFFLGYVVLRSALNPELAPSYNTEHLGWKDRLVPFFRDVVPLFGIFVVVVGSMIVGIATPTESASLGVLAAIVAGLAYRCITFSVLKRSVLETAKFAGMILIIICGSGTFSQILAFSGTTQSMATFVLGQSAFSPETIVFFMLLLVLFLGFLMESASIMMLTLPIFVPIIAGLHIDGLWFGILMLVSLEIGLITPPFGVLLFTLQGVLKGSASLPTIYRAVFPFIAIEIFVLGLIFMFPGLISWLPPLLRKI